MSALLIVLSLVFAESPKDANDSIDQAKRFFDAGKRAYRSGQYGTAVLAFREAFALAPRPEIIFSTAQAHRLQYFVDHELTNLEEAVELYGRYVREVPRGGRREDAVRFLAELEPMLRDERRRPAKARPRALEETQLLISSATQGARGSVDGGAASELPLVASVTPGSHKIEVTAKGHADLAREAVAVAGKLVVVEVDLDALPARLELAAESGAEVSVDGRPFGETPLLAPIEIEAGRHFVALTASGRIPFTRELDLVRGETASLEVELESTTQRRVANGVMVGALTGGAASGALAIVAWVAESSARSIAAQLEEGQNLSAEDRASYESSRMLRDGARTGAFVALGTAAAAAALAIVLQLSDHPTVEARPSAPKPVAPEPDWEP
ncbi:MAG: PEGA domain-containing protein [Deltaproteobacteria bacterium]|nr:PEGA domain-containing protein [Deltaproteobacteria bacterium]